MDATDLPAVNASLNAVSLVLLLAGYHQIRRGNVRRHKRLMICAFAVSVSFLTCYITHRIMVGEYRFGGQGWIRPVYFVILISHVLLALTVPFLASTVLYLGLRDRITRHRRWAKLTLPIWLYVSVTGVLVYLLLFRLYTPIAPHAATG